MRNYRLKQLEETILGERDVFLEEELRESFGVSMNTIRRDIAELLRRGNIEKFTAASCKAEDFAVAPMISAISFIWNLNNG